MGHSAVDRARTRRGRARSGFGRGLAVVVGMALLGPALAAAPVQAVDDFASVVPLTGELLPLVAPVPTIAAGEAGSLEFGGSVVCTADGTVTTVCDELPLELADLEGLDPSTLLRLVAVPLDPTDVPRWVGGCPEVLDEVCLIPLSALFEETPLEPVVEFLPGDDDQSGDPADPGDSGDTGGGDPSEKPSTEPDVIDTKITAGPRARAWVLKKKVGYRFASNYDGAMFDCTVGNKLSACDKGVHALSAWKLRGGTHVFKVQAFTKDQRDTTPARRAFNVPMDDRALKAVKAWTRTKQKGHFKNTVSESSTKGASLVTAKPQKFRRVALVADKGPGYGTVKVFWNKKLLKKVSLHSSRTHKRKVVPIKKFTGKVRQGRLRVVVVSSGKTVRIDGLGVAQR
jgi:hypothetical protein